MDSKKVTNSGSFGSTKLHEYRIFEFRHKYNTFIIWIFLNVWLNCSMRFENITTLIVTFNNFRRSNLFMGGRILKGLGIQTSFSFVCIPSFKANFLFFWRLYGLGFFYQETIYHDLMASIWEKKNLILAGNMNSGPSYLITGTPLLRRFLIGRISN